MGYMFCMGNCLRCGGLFNFNPDRVPTLRVTIKDGVVTADPNGQREPICPSCFDALNEFRIAHGLEPWQLPEGAYEAQEVA